MRLIDFRFKIPICKRRIKCLAIDFLFLKQINTNLGDSRMKKLKNLRLKFQEVSDFLHFFKKINGWKIKKFLPSLPLLDTWENSCSSWKYLDVIFPQRVLFSRILRFSAIFSGFQWKKVINFRSLASLAREIWFFVV